MLTVRLRKQNGNSPSKEGNYIVLMETHKMSGRCSKRLALVYFINSTGTCTFFKQNSLLKTIFLPLFLKLLALSLSSQCYPSCLQAMPNLWFNLSENSQHLAAHLCTYSFPFRHYKANHITRA